MVAQQRAHHRRAQLPPNCSSSVELGDRRARCDSRVALAQQRLDHLLEQARLAIGGDPPAAEVAGVDAERRGSASTIVAISSASSS